MALLPSRCRALPPSLRLSKEKTIAIVVRRAALKKAPSSTPVLGFGIFKGEGGGGGMVGSGELIRFPKIVGRINNRLE